MVLRSLGPLGPLWNVRTPILVVYFFQEGPFKCLGQVGPVSRSVGAEPRNLGLPSTAGRAAVVEAMSRGRRSGW